MAVGGMGMLSTSNYVARRYGVRAAMPGFIAMKLCKNLKIVPPNFEKYTKVSKEVKEIALEYDPHLTMGSLDEAYLDLTIYIKIRMYVLRFLNESDWKEDSINNESKSRIHEVCTKYMKEVNQKGIYDTPKSTPLNSPLRQLKQTQKSQVNMNKESDNKEKAANIEELSKMSNEAEPELLPESQGTLIEKSDDEESRLENEIETEDYDPLLDSQESRKKFTSYKSGEPVLVVTGDQILASHYIQSTKIDWSLVQDVVKEIRTRIYAKTQLTSSAGIGKDKMIAKIAADIKKPNGQFYIENSKAYIQNLPIRKVPGVGKVTEKILVNACGISKCGDLFQNRYILYYIFSEKTAKWLIQVSFGISSFLKDTRKEKDSNGHNITPPISGGNCGAESLDMEELSRKGISKERTFASLAQPTALISKCVEICSSLFDQIENLNIEGKTVTLKLKKVDFDVITRSYTYHIYIPSKDILINIVTAMLKKEIPINIRLMGVRMSALRSKNTKNRFKQRDIASCIGTHNKGKRKQSPIKSSSEELQTSRIKVNSTEKEIECVEIYEDDKAPNLPTSSSIVKTILEIDSSQENNEDDNINIKPTSDLQQCYDRKSTANLVKTDNKHTPSLSDKYIEILEEDIDDIVQYKNNKETQILDIDDEFGEDVLSGELGIDSNPFEDLTDENSIIVLEDQVPTSIKKHDSLRSYNSDDEIEIIHPNEMKRSQIKSESNNENSPVKRRRKSADCRPRTTTVSSRNKLQTTLKLNSRNAFGVNVSYDPKKI